MIVSSPAFSPSSASCFATLPATMPPPSITYFDFFIRASLTLHAFCHERRRKSVNHHLQEWPSTCCYSGRGDANALLRAGISSDRHRRRHVGIWRSRRCICRHRQDLVRSVPGLVPGQPDYAPWQTSVAGACLGPHDNESTRSKNEPRPASPICFEARSGAYYWRLRRRSVGYRNLLRRRRSIWLLLPLDRMVFLSPDGRCAIDVCASGPDKRDRK